MSQVKINMIEALKQIGNVGEDGSIHLSKEDIEQFLTRGRRGAKKTKGPKRVVAPSAFRLFMTANLEKIRSEYPEACEGRGNLLKKIGEVWKQMKEDNDPQVEKYEKESKIAKEQLSEEKSKSQTASEAEPEAEPEAEAEAEAEPEAEAEAEPEAEPEAETKTEKKFAPFSEEATAEMPKAKKSKKKKVSKKKEKEENH